MSFQKEGLLLRIFVGSSDKYGNMPLYEWVIRKAREQGLSGATALRGKEGFGVHGNIHGAEVLPLAKDQPMVIELIDTFEKIDAFTSSIEEAISVGLATVAKVQIHHFGGS